MASNGPIGKISKKVASGIAFATEVHQHNKAKKAARKQQELDGEVAQPPQAQPEDETRSVHTITPTSPNDQKEGESHVRNNERRVKRKFTYQQRLAESEHTGLP